MINDFEFDRDDADVADTKPTKGKGKREKKDSGGYTVCTRCGDRFFRGKETPYICGRCIPRHPEGEVINWRLVPGSTIVAKQTESLLQSMQDHNEGEAEQQRVWRK